MVSHMLPLGRLFFLICIATCLVCVAHPASAKDDGTIQVTGQDLHKLTFSRLVLRLRGDRDISIAPEEYRVRFLEALRRRGYPALGAESLVFGQDRADDARFVLGGTITGLQCKRASRRERRCEATTRWELMDRTVDGVVYQVETRHVATASTPEKLGDLLVWGTFHSLLKRQGFVAALSKGSAEAGPPEFAPAHLRKCAAVPQSLPKDTAGVLDATVLVRSGQRLGSGTIISPDGLVLTAAHVVASSDTVELQLHSGLRVKATVIRINEKSDTALLRIPDQSNSPCLPLGPAEFDLGSEIYAVGSPLGSELSFSVTRGIVSGFRDLDGVHYVQTDASVNRGNSGGPLVDQHGRWVGVIAWKPVGTGVEGIAFGIPSAAAFASLGLSLGDETDPALARTQPLPNATKSSGLVVDLADPSTFSDAPATSDDRRIRGRAPKGYALTATGLGMLAVGGGVGIYFIAVDDDEDYSDRAAVAGLGLATIGAAVLIAAWARATPHRPSKKQSPAPRVTADVGPGSIAIQGVF